MDDDYESEAFYQDRYMESIEKNSLDKPLQCLTNIELLTDNKYKICKQDESNPKENMKYIVTYSIKNHNIYLTIYSAKKSSGKHRRDINKNQYPLKRLATVGIDVDSYENNLIRPNALSEYNDNFLNNKTDTTFYDENNPFSLLHNYECKTFGGLTECSSYEARLSAKNYYDQKQTIYETDEMILEYFSKLNKEEASNNDFVKQLELDKVKTAKVKYTGTKKWFGFNINKQLYFAFEKLDIDIGLFDYDESFFETYTEQIKLQLMEAISLLSRELNCGIFIRLLNKFFPSNGSFIEKFLYSFIKLLPIIKEELRSNLLFDEIETFTKLTPFLFKAANMLQDGLDYKRNKANKFTIVNIFKSLNSLKQKLAEIIV